MLKKIVIGLVGLIVLFLVIGFLLPRDYAVERSTVIDAPPEAVKAHVADLRRWPAWDPWSSRDETMEHSYEGAESGEGAIQTWTSEDSGEGRLEIVEETEQILAMELSFEGQGTAKTSWRFEPVDGGKTKVTWDMSGEMDPPIGPWFGLAMDGMIGGDYEQGLANLKRLVEGGGDADEGAAGDEQPEPQPAE